MKATGQSDLCTILVNSTDSFQDCWVPFFTLFREYWPDCPYRVVLNTEVKDFSFPGIDITASKVCEGSTSDKPMPWGRCLRQCLDMIDTEIILYMQEDYFLKAAVDSQQVDELVRLMSDRSWTHQTCGHIGLTHFGSWSPFHLTEYPLLWEIDQHAAYRVSLQAGLWKKSSLRTYVRGGDTPWEFEHIGSIRAQRVRERFLTVSRHVISPEGRQIIPYTHTGIIRGKWNRDAVEDLFARHEIDVDFSTRGFFVPDVPRPKGSLGRRVSNKIRGVVCDAIDSLRSR